MEQTFFQKLFTAVCPGLGRKIWRAAPRCGSASSSVSLHFADFTGPPVVVSGMSGRLVAGVDVKTDAGDAGDDKKHQDGLTAKAFSLEFGDQDVEKCCSLQRLVLETAYEAMIDGGICPASLDGTDTSVFVVTAASKPCSQSDEGRAWLTLADLVSFEFNLKGLSRCLDATSDPGIFPAIEQATEALQSGSSKTAVVIATNSGLPPRQPEEETLDALAGEESVRRQASEMVVAVVLQVAEVANRAYAEILDCRAILESCNGDMDQCIEESGGVSPPSPEWSTVESDLGAQDPALGLCSFVSLSLNLDRAEPAVSLYLRIPSSKPLGLSYASDATNEKRSKHRETNPLDRGGTTGGSDIPSDNGPKPHGEVLSSDTSTTKSEPTELVEHPTRVGNDESLTVTSAGVSEPPGGVQFQFQGKAGFQLYLRTPFREEEPSLPDRVLLTAPQPQIVAVSGPSKQMVEDLLAGLQKYDIDDPVLALTSLGHQHTVPGHHYRGFLLMTDGREGRPKVVKHVQKISTRERSLWLVFPGVGNGWISVGRALLALPVLGSSIRKCSEALKSLEVDLLQILSSEFPPEKTSHLIVALVSVQISLIDLLTHLNLQPDGFIGQSFGEISCGYADGCLSAEQAVRIAYWAGRSIENSKSSKGAMAIIAQSPEEMKSCCPAEIFLSCHASENSVIVSGPTQSVKSLVERLTDQLVAADDLNSDVAYNCVYTSSAAKTYKKKIGQIILTPKPRTRRWISTSVPAAQWSQREAVMAGASYFVNNMTRTVLFYEALGHVPRNAVVIEMAPHCPHLVDLKSSLPPEASLLRILTRNSSHSLWLFLKNLSLLFLHGLNPHFSQLYPPLMKPVPQSTSSISLLRGSLPVFLQPPSELSPVPSSAVPKCFSKRVSHMDPEFGRYFYTGAVPVFPHAGFIGLVWEAASEMRSGDSTHPGSFLLEDILISSLPESSDKDLDVAISLLQSPGGFEVTVGDVTVVSGRVTAVDGHTIGAGQSPGFDPQTWRVDESLTEDDIRSELKLRGYDYGSTPSQLKRTDFNVRNGSVFWNENLRDFLDALVQFHVINLDSRTLCQPAAIGKLSINLKAHNKLTNLSAEVDVPVWRTSSGVQSAVVGMEDVIMRDVKEHLKNVLLQSYEFVPYFGSDEEPWVAAGVLTDLVLENISDRPLRLLGVSDDEATILTFVLRRLALQPHATVDCSLTRPAELRHVRLKKTGKNDVRDAPCHLLVMETQGQLTEALDRVAEGGFVLTTFGTLDDNRRGLLVVAERDVPGVCSLRLYKKVCTNLVPPLFVCVPQDTHLTFSWVTTLKNKVNLSREERQRLYVIVKSQEVHGVLGLVKCLRTDIRGRNLRCIFVSGPNTYLPGDLSHPTYAPLLRRDLVMNVYHGGQWGSYGYVPLTSPNLTANRCPFMSQPRDITETGNRDGLPMLFSPRKTYIVTDGSSRIGDDFCDWLVSKGVQRLLIVSSSAEVPSSKFAQWRRQRWKQKGVEVSERSAQIRSKQTADHLVEEARTLGPLGGLFHLAGLDLPGQVFDAQNTKLTPRAFSDAAASGLVPLLYLDAALARYDLDHFVTVCGMAGGRGSKLPGVGYSCSAMERLCERRRKEGQPGVVLQLGLLDDGSTHSEELRRMEATLGVAVLNVTTLRAVLDEILCRTVAERSAVGCASPDAEGGHVPDQLTDKCIISCVVPDVHGRQMAAQGTDKCVTNCVIPEVLGRQVSSHLTERTALNLGSGDVKPAFIT